MSEIRPPGKSPPIFLAAVCGLVVVLYFWTTTAAYHGHLLPDPKEDFYNRLVEGFRAGHLSLQLPAPAGLVQLPDPYDPQANYAYRLQPPYWLHDLSYFQGRLYVYFGVTPAVLLYWPWQVLTGQPLSDQGATAIFCALAFLAGAGLMWAGWRRYFPTVPAAVPAAGALALGLGAELPILLQRAKEYEVAISCGLALTLLSALALWRSLHSPRRGAAWLAAASAALALAVGARPSLALGVIFLSLPVLLAPRGARGVRLVAAAVPLALIGGALMLYNEQRFGSPWEFGQHFQLASDRQEAVRHFSLSNLWFNFRVYFLEPVTWTARFPWVGPLHSVGAPPAGHAPIEDPYGILTNVPLVWLALAVPLAWRRPGSASPAVLRAFLLGFAALAGIFTLTLLAFYGSCSRYEAEFLPALTLLAVFGYLGGEAAVSTRPGAQGAWRAAGAVLLIFSVAVTLLNAVRHAAIERDAVGQNMIQLNRTAEAIPQFESALRLMPDFPEAEVDLGNALSATAAGLPAAITHFQAVLRERPDNPEVHFDLGNCLLRTPGRAAEAITQYETALRLKPDYAEAHFNLGVALMASPSAHDEALAQFEAALRLQPDSAPARQMVDRLRATRRQGTRP